MGATFDEHEFQRLSELLKKYLRSRPDAKRKRSVSYIDDFDLLRNYLEVKAKLGYIPREAELGRHGRYSRNNYRNHFGTYGQFLVILGERKPPTTPPPNVIAPYMPRGRSKKGLAIVAENGPGYLSKPQKEPVVLDLIKEYHRLKAKLGRPPKPKDIDNHSVYPLEVFNRVFYTLDRLNNLPFAAQALMGRKVREAQTHRPKRRVSRRRHRP